MNHSRTTILKLKRHIKQITHRLANSLLLIFFYIEQQESTTTCTKKFAAQRTGGRVTLGPATLYTVLSKFEKEGYIREVAVEGRKRTYALTPRGAGAYYEELTRLRLCVADAEKGGDL